MIATCADSAQIAKYVILKAVREKRVTPRKGKAAMAEYFTKDGDEFKKVEETLLTQSDIETSFLPKRLERERAKFADYDTLKEKASKVDTITSEYEEKLKAAGTEKADLVAQLGKAKLETEKVKVIHQFKLSDELSEFVTGDTVDEMKQRAEKLAKGFTGGKVTVQKTGKPDEAKATDSKQIAGKLFGKKSDD